MTKFGRATCFAAIVTAMTIGCSSEPLGQIEGTVTIDGVPAMEGLSLEFTPAVPNDLGKSLATVDGSGRYTARNAATGQSGAALGLCVIRVVENEKTTILPKREGSRPKRLLADSAYTDIKRFEIKPGLNTVDIELSKQ